MVDARICGSAASGNAHHVISHAVEHIEHARANTHLIKETLAGVGFQVRRDDARHRYKVVILVKLVLDDFGTAPPDNTGLVITVARNIHAHHQGILLVLVLFSLADHSGLNKVGGDELRGALARELTENADANIVAILAVVLHQLVKVFLVSHLGAAAVDVADNPAEFARVLVALLPAIVEHAARTCRVPEGKPHSAWCGHGTRGNLPNNVRNTRRLVEYHKRVFLVLTGERLRIAFRPRDSRREPGFRLVNGSEAFFFPFEHISDKRHFVPLCQLTPCTVFKLPLGVGRHSTQAPRSGRHIPKRDPGRYSRLTDTVTGRHSHTDRPAVALLALNCLAEFL